MQRVQRRRGICQDPFCPCDCSVRGAVETALFAAVAPVPRTGARMSKLCRPTMALPHLPMSARGEPAVLRVRIGCA